MAPRSSSTSSLDQLAIRYGTDKSSRAHGYTHHYSLYLEASRRLPLTVLELGWGGHEDPEQGGASAQMWRDYFPNGTVVCIDVEDKTLTKAHEGIHFRQGSQDDPEFIQQLADEFGSFDVVVDDASHISSLTIRSWELLYPHLASGGIYAVEDTHSSYHEQFYGPEEACADPSTFRNTAMHLFKRMADEVNFKGRDGWDPDWDLFPRKYWWGYELDWVHFYFDILFLKKR